MIHRLSIILKKCENKKFRIGYMRYLSSLDFNEFEELFSHYSTIIAKLLLRYQKNKIKLFSKNWFKLSNLEYKWHQLYRLFSLSNPYFVELNMNNLDIKNTKKMDLIMKINETRKELESIISNPIILNQNSNQEEIIKFNLIIIDSIYTSEKLTKLVDELNNIQ
jgi:hypothetical protein